MENLNTEQRHQADQASSLVILNFHSFQSLYVFVVQTSNFLAIVVNVVDIRFRTLKERFLTR